MKIANPKKKKRSLSARGQDRSSDQEDRDSLENQTNLNWRTGAAPGKRLKCKAETRRVSQAGSQIFITDPRQEGEGEILASDFLKSSHFFIDQLKAEFCDDKGGGWYSFKKEVDEAEATQEDLPIIEPKFQSDARTLTKEEQFNSGKWTHSEHSLFLEGLRLFGKDWPRIQAHIGSRNVKAVISHGQKFLIKLVNFLNREDLYQAMTLEEAQFYYGILKKKVHWMSKMRDERRQAKEEGKLFYVQKVQQVKPAMMPLGSPAIAIERAEPQKPCGGIDRAKAEVESSYEAWKQAIPGADQRSFHQSLGHSIKMKTIQSQTSKGKVSLSFKADLELKPSEEEEADSATSQSSAHLKKYHLEDEFNSRFLSNDLLLKIQNMMTDQYLTLPDIEKGQTNFTMKVRTLPDGPSFDLLRGHSSSDIIASLYRREDKDHEFRRTHPNLNEVINQFTSLQLHEQGLHPTHSQEKENPLKQFILGLTQEDLENIYESGIEIFMEHLPEGESLFDGLAK